MNLGIRYSLKTIYMCNIINYEPTHVVDLPRRISLCIQCSVNSNTMYVGFAEDTAIGRFFAGDQTPAKQIRGLCRPCGSEFYGTQSVLSSIGEVSSNYGDIRAKANAWACVSGCQQLRGSR